MNIIHKVTWKSMWKNRTRTLVTIISVMLSAAMFMAVVTLVYSLWDFVVQGHVHEAGDFFVEFNHATDEQYEALKVDKRVSYVADFKVLGYHCFLHVHNGSKINGFHTYPIGAVDEEFLEHMSIPLIEGRLPENSSELIIPSEYNVVREMNDEAILSVGDTITLEMLNYIRSDASREIQSEDAYAKKNGINYREFEKEFTVVGIMDQRCYSGKEPDSNYFITMLTVSDGNEGDTLWHKLYAKTNLPWQAYDLVQEGYGGESQTYRQLLNAYGLTEETNQIIIIMAVLLVGIVLVASINPIRNAFSISVSERTLQFGLLASIGTTKKQIRRSILYEAGVIALFSVPIGILAGFGLVAALFAVWQDRIAHVYRMILEEIIYSSESSLIPEVSLSWIVIVITVLICVATILISIRIPARRATKITPIEAIRQQRELKVREKQIKVGTLTDRLFGVPGVLAKKYYRTSRKKYRTTVTSISVGMVLFIAVNYLGDTCKMSLDIEQKKDYDLSYRVSSSEKIHEELEYAMNVPGIKIAVALYDIGSKEACVPYGAYTDGYKQLYDIEESGESEGHKNNATVFYLEDEYFAECLRNEGIDPTPYLTAEEMLGVTVETNHRSFKGYDEERNAIYEEYFGSWLKVGEQLYLGEGDSIDLMKFYNESWDDLEEIKNGTMSMVSGESRVNAKGETILKYTAFRAKENSAGEEVILAAYLVEYSVDVQEGKLICNYYRYDHKNGKRGELVLSESQNATTIRVGESLSVTPFGVGDNYDNRAAIMPMCQLPEGWKSSEKALIRMNTSNYYDTVNEFNQRELRDTDFHYTDYVKDKYRVHMTLDLMQFISNSLIIMISLISAVNIFNTITANIALRRRDFGMLRGIGMSDRDINRMIGFECISCGAKALGISVPIGLMACGITYLCVYRYYHTGVAFPWQTICFGSLMVFLIVFASAFYAVSKLRRDNPIDAIRMENL